MCSHWPRSIYTCGVGTALICIEGLRLAVEPPDELGRARVGTALICIEGLRLEPPEDGGERVVDRVRTALICIEGLRRSPPGGLELVDRDVGRNCPDLY